jgi:hypothetical protein
MKRVFIASPLRNASPGLVARNEAYARFAMRECLSRGESPFAPHLLLPQVLDDRLGGDRLLGITAGQAWLERADLLAVYDGLGVSEGMAAELALAEHWGIPIEHRKGGINSGK